MNNNEFFEALGQLEKEKGIPAEYLAEKIQNAIIVAVRRDYGGKDIVFCNINISENKFDVYVRKEVVDEVEDVYSQILPSDAKKYDSKAQVGDFVEIHLDTNHFGRIVALTAKHVIRQGIREAERGQMMEEFQSRQQELVTAVVQRVDPKTGAVTVEIGKAEAVLPRSEQLENDEFQEGDHIKVFIVDVKDTGKGPRAMISRTHPGLVKRLFELEVPEIYSGEIEIKAISREAGSRTKLAVYSKDENLDAVGSCIGQRGARVNKIVEELGGEKIDIVKYSDNPEEFIAEALSPAEVVSVEIVSAENRSCRVSVPDEQLSLAIGNKGQNARLAARLTGWKIDILPASGFYGE